MEQFNTDNTGSLDGEQTFSWTYDNIDRLIKESFDITAPGTSDYTDHYLFDLEGNRVAKRRDALSDGTINDVTTYRYDKNDRLELEQVDTDNDAPGAVGPTEATTTYYYNDNGDRVKSCEGQGSADCPGTATKFLIDTNNPTRYSQVLEERNNTNVIQRSYTLGNDVISQAESGSVYHMLYDAHGSTRALILPNGQFAVNGSINEVYTYEAYGNLVGFDATKPSTNLHYSGEWTDSTDLQYLRARYYDPKVGRFSSLDAFAGNTSDPQSLHKYAYVHGDPVQGLDPTGHFNTTTVLAGVAIGTTLVAGVLNLSQELSALAHYAFRTGTGGYNGTTQLTRLREDLVSQWDRLSDARKEAIAKSIHSLPTAIGAWDITEFVGPNKDTWNPNGTAIGNTLTFRNRVYRIAEVNYVLWGLLNGLAHRDGIMQSYTSKENAATRVLQYRAVAGSLLIAGEWLQGRSGWNESIYGKQRWTEFGWEWATNPSATEPLAAIANALPADITYPRGRLNFNVRFGSSQRDTLTQTGVVGDPK